MVTSSRPVHESEVLSEDPPGGLIDVHTHAISRALPDLSRKSDYPFWPTVESIGANRAQILLGGKRYRDIDDRCWSASRRLEDMDRDGVAVQCVSPVPATLCYDAPAEEAQVLALVQNEFMAALAQESGGRLLGLGSVPLQSPKLAIAELEHCMNELSLLGVMIGPRAGSSELMDPAFESFFQAADDLGALLFLHPSDQLIDDRFKRLGVAFGLGMPADTAVAVGALLMQDLLVERPCLKILLAHGGGALPGLLPRLGHGWTVTQGDEADAGTSRSPVAQARKLYADSLTYDAACLRMTVKQFGEGHVMLGTDYPFLAQEVPPGHVLQSDGISEALRLAIGSQNARGLLEDITERGRRTMDGL